MYTSDKGEYRSPWAEGGEPKMKFEPPKLSGPKIITPTVFIVLGLLGVGAILGALYYFLPGPQSGESISIQFTKPSQVLLGQPFALPVSISNISDKVLKSARISVALPDGVSFVGAPQSQRVKEQSLGDVGPGSISQQTFNLIATNGPQSVKRIEAKIIYSTEANANNQFENIGDADVLVGDPAVTLTLATPTSIFNGQDFEMKVNYSNNMRQDLKNLHLKMSYPPIYHFTKASITPENDGKNSWNLGVLPSGANGSFTITGQVIGAERSFFDMSGVLTADFQGETYTLNTQAASLAISSAPLSVAVTLVNDAGSEYLPKLGETLNYVLHYKNNSTVVFEDVNLRATLTGVMFDFPSLQTPGTFNSLTNTVNWFAANTPELAHLPPGKEGTVTFSVKVKPAFPLRLVSDKNFTLKVDGQVDSPTIPPGTTAPRTVSVGSLENKIPGQVTVDAKGFWRDAKSGIINSGPYPPRVNQKTQYTMHWIVANYGTDVTNAVVTANLPSGARCTGKVQSNASSQPLCNPDAGQVTWQIGNIPATRGVISSPLEAIFQIELTPSVNQQNTVVTLMDVTTIQAQDAFTGSTLSATDGPITTDIPDDPTINIQDRRVKP